MKEFRGYTDDGAPICSWALIQKAASQYKQFVIEVREYNEAREITRKQMAYLHAVVFPTFGDWIGCSEWWAELILKRKCGKQWFVRKMDGAEVILSKTTLSVKNGTAWIENILDFADGLQGLELSPPDPEWYKHKKD